MVKSAPTKLKYIHLMDGLLMPTIQWTLQKTCDNCDAEVIVSSELGDKFKLSEARKEKDLFAKAQAWVSAHPFGHTEPYPDELAPFILERFVRLDPKAPRFIVSDRMFFYIKCPVCSSRIYVC